MIALKSFPDIFNVCHFGVGIYWLPFLIHFKILLILDVTSYFVSQSGHLGYFVIRVIRWILFKHLLCWLSLQLIILEIAKIYSHTNKSRGQRRERRKRRGRWEGNNLAGWKRVSASLKSSVIRRMNLYWKKRLT